jgi:hypothetical protein
VSAPSSRALFPKKVGLAFKVDTAEAAVAMFIIEEFVSTLSATNTNVFGSPEKYPTLPPTPLFKPDPEANGSPEIRLIEPVPRVLTSTSKVTVTNLPTFVYLPVCAVYVVFPPKVGVQVPSS